MSLYIPKQSNTPGLTREEIFDDIKKNYYPTYKQYNQEHVFTNVEQLDDERLNHLYSSIRSFSLPYLSHTYSELSCQEESNRRKHANFSPYNHGGLDLSSMFDIESYAACLPASLHIPTTPFESSKGEYIAPTNPLLLTVDPTTYIPTALPNETAIASPSQRDIFYYYHLAMQAIIHNQLGVVILAGGQGTRLGFDKPKAVFVIDTPSQCTLLLRLIYSRYLILQLAKHYFLTYYQYTMKLQDNNNNHHDNHIITIDTISIPLIILTSGTTEAFIQEYIDNLHEQCNEQCNENENDNNNTNNTNNTHNHKEFITKEMLKDIYFTRQTSLPAVDRDSGKIFIADDYIQMSPNGNGGVYAALFPLLDEFRYKYKNHCKNNNQNNMTHQDKNDHDDDDDDDDDHNVKIPVKKQDNNNDCDRDNNKIVYNLTHIMLFNIDNTCGKVCDPISIGYSIYTQTDVSVKCVPKVDPHEKVGVLGLKNGKFSIVEYSEIAEKATERDETTHALKYIDGNTNTIIFRIEFLYKYRQQLTDAVRCPTTTTTSQSTPPTTTPLPNINDTNDNTPYVHDDTSLPLHRADKLMRKCPNPIRDGLITANTTSSSYIDNNNHHHNHNDDTFGNVIKFELFVFDCFPMASSLKVIRVNRHNHFLPVKNKNNPNPVIITSDSPAYCIQKSTLTTLTTLLHHGYTIYDTKGRVIVDQCLNQKDNMFISKQSVREVSNNSNHAVAGAAGDDDGCNKKLYQSCLGFNFEMDTDNNNNNNNNNNNDQGNNNKNNTVCLCQAHLGAGVELDITQFYVLTFPSVCLIPTPSIPTSSTSLLPPPSDAHNPECLVTERTLHLADDKSFIIHIDHSITELPFEKTLQASI